MEEERKAAKRQKRTDAVRLSRDREPVYDADGSRNDGKECLEENNGRLLWTERKRRPGAGCI